MKSFAYLFIPFFISIQVGCQSASNEITQKFNKINNELEDANKIMIENDFKSIYQRIQKKKPKIQELASRADSLFFATEDVLKLIDSLQNDLKAKDPSGKNLATQDYPLINKKNAAKLTQKIRINYQLNRTILNKAQLSMENEKSHNHFENIYQNKDWIFDFFQNIPTFAAITILQKMKLDTINISTLSFNQILAH